MDLGLVNKKALVLASSRGLGFGVAQALVREGAHVVVTGRRQERLDDAVARLSSEGVGRVSAVAIDFADPGAPALLAQTARRHLGRVDILVNNTGGPPPGSIAEVTAPIWDAQFAVMVRNVMTLTADLLPDMRAQGWGRVLTLASSGVVQPIPNLGISNAMRAALVGWSKTLSAEVGAEGVTVNVLVPGRIHTERVDELDLAAAQRSGRDVAAVVASSKAAIPLKRYGSVDEFAAVATFLVSTAASYVTGSVVRCDGGAIQSV